MRRAMSVWVCVCLAAWAWPGLAAADPPRGVVSSSSKILSSGYDLTLKRAGEIGAERRGKDPRRARREAHERANHELAMQWAIKAREFATSMSLEESEHFLFFQALEGRNDRPLATVAERAYRTWCNIAGIPADQDVWCGKLPVFIFRNVEHYRKFSREILARPEDPPAAWHGRLVNADFVCLTTCETRTEFYELFVRQAAACFLDRHVGQGLRPWLRDGLATLAASRAVGGTSDQPYRQAARQALRQQRDVSELVTAGQLKDDERLIAFGMVRYLTAIDAQAMRRLVDLLCEGREQAQALEATYRLTPGQLAREWREAALREVGTD